jgi:hypothetical protein
MATSKKILTIVLALCFLAIVAVPGFSEDRTIDPKRDLKGISPKRHRYIFSVLGGAAAGAGLGAILGSGNDLTKGALLGGGAVSSLYLSSHRKAGNGYRDWAYIASHTALGTGVGWTICGCDDGAVAGALIGGGATAAWRAMTPEGRRRTANTVTQP